MALDALEYAIREALEVNPSELTNVAYVATMSLRLQLREFERLIPSITGDELPSEQIV